MYRRRIIEPEPGIQPAVGAHFVVFTQSISKVQQQLFFGFLIVITPTQGIFTKCAEDTLYRQIIMGMSKPFAIIHNSHSSVLVTWMALP